MDDLLGAILQLLHLCGRRPLATDEDAEESAGIPRRKKGLGDRSEQSDRPDQAKDPGQSRDPPVLQEPPERFRIEPEKALLESPDRAFHPGPPGPRTAVLEQPRAHERSQRERD